LEERECPRRGEELNQSLERAGRVADYLELADLIVHDALIARRILRLPFPRGTPDTGRRVPRNDEQYAYVAAWEFTGVGKTPTLNEEPLVYEEVHFAQRSYK